MREWLFSFMEEFGYVGIMLIIALENVFPPIPSEVVLPFGGFMTTKTTLTLPGVILAATIGSVLGAIILYGVGRMMSIQRLESLVEKWRPILRVKKNDIRTAEGWFIRYGNWTVFFCRFIPMVRSLISVPAGMARMNGLSFILFTALGTAIWNITLVSLGALLGESWEEILTYFEVYKSIFYLFFVLVMVFLLTRVFKRHRSKH